MNNSAGIPHFAMVTFSPIHPIIHLLMILVLFTISLAVIVIGRHAQKRNNEHIISKSIGILLLIIWCVYNAYYFQPEVFDISVSLPLHVCDLLAIISSIAMLLPNRRTSSLLYFCGLGLAVQAVITPVGNQSPETLRFWLFWSLHIGIIASALYDLFVRKFHPNIKDFCFTLLCDLIYLVIILPIDIFFDWNYGYVGNTVPTSATFIDLLGPWPQRILWLLLIVVSIQTVLYIPWLLLTKYGIKK